MNTRMYSARIALLCVLMGVVCLLLLTAAPQVHAKRVAGAMTLVSNKVNQVGKFSFRPVGWSVINGTVTYKGEPRGAIYLFIDTEWEKYHAETDDCTRMSKATAQLNIGTTISSGYWIAESSVREVKSDTFEFSFHWKDEHKVRTYGYYLVVADCFPGSHKRFKAVEYDFNFYNDGSDHFPADEHGLLTLYILCFVGMAVFAYQQLISKRKMGRNTKSEFSLTGGSDGPPPAAMSLLIFSYCCEMLSILFEVLHLWWYQYNGSGIFFFDFFSEVLEGCAQTGLSYLLLAFAGGWTLIEGTITSKSEGAINPEALGEDHPSTLFIAMMAVLTVLLQLLNKIILFDDFTKFHDHESWPGMILVMVRAVMAGFFTYQIYQTISYMTRRGNRGGSTLKFMQSLALLGGLWFWVFPVLVFVARIFAHYLRHRIVAGGVLFLQSGCLVLLTKQITAESSAYSKASLHRGVILGDRHA